MFLLKASENK